MEPIKYALDAQGAIYVGNRVIARDNPDNPQSAADLAGLVFRANAAGELLSVARKLLTVAEDWPMTQAHRRQLIEEVKATIAKATGGQP